MIFLLLFSLTAHAAELPIKKYHIGKYEYVVEERMKNVWINQSCGEKCKALLAVKSTNEKSLKIKNQSGSMNPGAWLCTNVAKGKVFIAVDEEKNQLSFCKFDDGSYVNNGAFR